MRSLEKKPALRIKREPFSRSLNPALEELLGARYRQPKMMPDSGPEMWTSNDKSFTGVRVVL